MKNIAFLLFWVFVLAGFSVFAVPNLPQKASNHFNGKATVGVNDNILTIKGINGVRVVRFNSNKDIFVVPGQIPNEVTVKNLSDSEVVIDVKAVRDGSIEVYNKFMSYHPQPYDNYVDRGNFYNRSMVDDKMAGFVFSGKLNMGKNDDYEVVLARYHNSFRDTDYWVLAGKRNEWGIHRDVNDNVDGIITPDGEYLITHTNNADEFLVQPNR